MSQKIVKLIVWLEMDQEVDVKQAIDQMDYSFNYDGITGSWITHFHEVDEDFVRVFMKDRQANNNWYQKLDPTEIRTVVYEKEDPTPSHSPAEVMGAKLSYYSKLDRLSNSTTKIADPLCESDHTKLNYTQLGDL